MTNNDKLANIEYLRERADVSYEEAERLLDRYDGNVLRALVELEHQGRVFAEGRESEADEGPQQHASDASDGMKKAKSFLQSAFQTHLVFEKKAEGDKPNVVANVPVPFAVIAAVAAPWLAVGTAAVTFATGHNVRVEKEAADKQDD